MPAAIEIRTTVVHGYRRQYRIGGWDSGGSPVLLLHGIGDSSATWAEVLPMLAEHHLVVAPDFLGHGGSDKPRADYSAPAFANGMRDLLTLLEIERVTIVGHSLGGGVAAQFAYQYPELVERLVLVAAGGAGLRVSPLLRLAATPFTEIGLAALRLPTAPLWLKAAIELLCLLDADLALDRTDVRRVFDALPDRDAASAFVRTLRSVVDRRGQVVTMLDRSYLVRDIPTMIMWGSRDAIVPSSHADTAHAAYPGSRLELFPGAGHFPFRTDAHRFVKLIEEFMATEEPAVFDRERWRHLLRAGRPDPAHALPAPVEAVEAAVSLSSS
ncbi:MAG: alpha/beta fold hydrolase [Jatrophihabitans sp.]|uniref:alpha/beta fold hydrolase n=1 Tax=Jatrophihabitans sp. TaxID=1932789 RepID=UPI003F7FA190